MNRRVELPHHNRGPIYTTPPANEPLEQKRIQLNRLSKRKSSHEWFASISAGLYSDAASNQAPYTQKPVPGLLERVSTSTYIQAKILQVAIVDVTLFQWNYTGGKLNVLLRELNKFLNQMRMEWLLVVAEVDDMERLLQFFDRNSHKIL